VLRDTGERSEIAIAAYWRSAGHQHPRHVAAALPDLLKPENRGLGAHSLKIPGR
jgi:hypothetical protein